MTNTRLKGLLDRDSFASQLAMQMQMERLLSKIEMLFTTRHCRVPCIYAQASQLCVAAAVSQIIESTTDGAMLRAHTRANNCLFSAPKGQGNVTSQGPKIIARSFSMVTKENTLRVNCTSPLDLLTGGLLTYYVYRLKLTQIHDIDLNI